MKSVGEAEEAYLNNKERYVKNIRVVSKVAEETVLLEMPRNTAPENVPCKSAEQGVQGYV